MAGKSSKFAVEVSKLSFNYDGFKIFNEIDLKVPEHTATLLLGANGVGKTTLLRILAGKHLVKPGAIKILGTDPFAGGLGPSHIKFVGGRFPLDLDIKVAELLEKNKSKDKKREKELLELLAIDPGWRMHHVSNGQRRRVDLFLSLMELPKVLLLDEITSDLDVLGRQELLGWLKSQTAKKKMTILFATHILDGMEQWASDVIFLKPGAVRCHHSMKKLLETAKKESKKTDRAPLLAICEKWFREDLENRSKAR